MSVKGGEHHLARLFGRRPPMEPEPGPHDAQGKPERHELERPAELEPELPQATRNRRPCQG